jgi:glutamyl-tRNA synthetase
MSGRKLSKRDVESGQTFLIKSFVQAGILPEALLNYVALFGWSARTTSDVHSLEDMIARVRTSPLGQINDKFTLDTLTTGSLRVSSDKLPFLNQKHILLKLSTESGAEDLVEACWPFLKDSLSLTFPLFFLALWLSREAPPREYVTRVLKVCYERMHTLKDLASAGWYFFVDPDYSAESLSQFREKYPSEIGIVPASALLSEIRPGAPDDLAQARCFERMGCSKY